MNKEMAELVGQAKDILFLAPLIEQKESPCHYVSAGNCGLMVSMSISGIQRNLGRGFIDAEMASRFADMASLRFRKYRRRLEWNYSEAQAIADTANTEECGGEMANFLLGRLHNELRGSLKECDVSAEPKAKTRRTVHSRLAALEAAFKALSILEAVVVSLQNEVNAANQTIASLAGPVVIVPPIHTTDPIPAYEPVFYPNITCTGPDPSLHITNTPPTIWKAKT